MKLRYGQLGVDTTGIKPLLTWLKIAGILGVKEKVLVQWGNIYRHNNFSIPRRRLRGRKGKIQAEMADRLINRDLLWQWRTTTLEHRVIQIKEMENGISITRPTLSKFYKSQGSK